MIMKSLKITLLLAALTAVFVLTVSGTSVEKNPAKVTQEVKEVPSKNVIDLVLIDRKKKKLPTSA